MRVVPGETQGSQNKGAIVILSRLLKYADKRFGLGKALDNVREARVQPVIPPGVIFRSIMLGLLSRTGSLNAFEQLPAGSWWQDWIGDDPPSTDRMGDVAAGVELLDIRDYLLDVYHNIRRKRGLQPLLGRLRPLVVDAHESFGSYLRCCPACRQRTISTKNGERTQYYHRYVTAALVHRDGLLLLDLEPQKPGEGEAAAAVRLLERLLRRCPRAFDVVSGDALYMDPAIWRLVRSHGKHIVAVLKNERRDLMTDARSLFDEVTPTCFDDGTTSYQLWDIPGFNTWTQVEGPVRVVRSLETSRVRRQRTGEIEETTSEWVWATSLQPDTTTKSILTIGHKRWSIENEGFNELVNHWHADHCYKHHPIAIQAFLLLTFIAYNIFHIFVCRDLKPALRDAHTTVHFARQVTAELYCRHATRPP